MERQEEICLPEAFQSRMRKMLGDEEYEAFAASYREPRLRGLRVNTMRIRPDEFGENAPFPVRRVPWVTNGFFYDNDVYPARHPYYAAGLYYLQEPSAMTPASRLPVTPGDRVLDLCAAPGGKATELAAKLDGKGLLVANDPSNSRAKALLRNLELFGTRNMLVTSEMPDRLASVFPSFFDRIQADAPCSGEGMFRKAPEVVQSWSPERVQYFASQQRNILENAWKMLRPGGLLMYSTCTFSPDEDEQMIAWFVREHPDMKLCEIESYEGFSAGRPDWADGNPELSKCVRIWPHKMPGEGHFMALMRKDAEGGYPSAGCLNNDRTGRSPEGKIGKEQRAYLDEFLSHTAAGSFDPGRFEQRADRAYYTQPLPDEVRGLNFLRNGLFVGEWKKKRFEPSQPMAMALSADTFDNALRLKADDPRLARYLRGETISVELGEAAFDGWILVCIENYAIGWGKKTGNLIKNKYLSSWRQN